MTNELLFDTLAMLHEIKFKIENAGLRKETIDKIFDKIDDVKTVLMSKEVSEQTHDETREEFIQALEDSLNFRYNRGEDLTLDKINEIMNCNKVNIQINLLTENKIFTVTDRREEI